MNNTAHDDSSKCDKCASGMVRPTRGTGRTFRGANNTPFPIPDDLVLYECAGCGARLLNGASIDALARAEENFRALFMATLEPAVPLALTHTEARVAYRYLKSAADFLKNKPRAQDDAKVLKRLVEKLVACGASKKAPA